MADLVFYTNTVSQKPLFNRFLLGLVGPAFETPSAAIFTLILSEIQRVFFLIYTTSLYFKQYSQFSEPLLRITFWATEYIGTEIGTDTLKINITVTVIGIFIILLWMGFTYLFLQASANKRTNSALSSLLRKLSLVYCGIIYALFHSTLLESLDRVIKADELTNTYRNNLVGVMITIVVLNFFTCFIIVMFSYEPLHFTRDILSRRNNFHLFISFIEKTGIVILLVSLGNSKLKALYSSIFTLMIELIGFIEFFRNLPYYNILALEVQTTFCLITFFISFLNILLAGLADYLELSLVFFMILLIIPFSIRLARNLISKKIQTILEKRPEDIKTQSDIFLFFIMLEKTIGSGRFNPQFDEDKPQTIYPYYLMAFIKDHNKTCQISRCACKFYVLKSKDDKEGKLKQTEEIIDQKTFSIDDQNALYNELMYYFKKDFLQQMTLSFPHWHHLKLTLANYIIDKQCENKVKALLLLYEVEKQTDSSVLKTKVAQLKWKIETGLKNDERSLDDNKRAKINIKGFIDSFNIYDDIQEAILKQLGTHLKFWHNLNVQEPPLAQLLKISNDCEHDYTKLQEKWRNDSKKIDPSFLQVFFSYGLFLRIVKNTREEAEAILKQAIIGYRGILPYQKKNKGIDLTNLYNENNIIIRISLQTDRFGIIIAASDNIAQYFGYESRLVLNKNVNFLMPEFIKQRHNDIIKAYLNTGKSSMMNMNRKVFGLHKNGYLMPFYMYITPFPHIDNDYSIIAILKKMSDDEDVIMLTPDGFIQGITKTVAEKLDVKIEYLYEYNVNAFCDKFQNINMVFNYFAYVRMKSNQLKIKVYEQPDLFDREALAAKSDALLSVGTDQFKASNQRIPVEETQTLAIYRENTQDGSKDNSKGLKSLKSSKFKREYREAMQRGDVEHEKEKTPTRKASEYERDKWPSRKGSELEKERTAYKERI